MQVSPKKHALISMGTKTPMDVLVIGAGPSALSIAAEDDDEMQIKMKKIDRLIKEESIFRYANMLKKLIEIKKFLN